MVKYDHVLVSIVSHVTVSTTVESVSISVTNALTLPLVKESYTSPMSVTVCLFAFSFSVFSAAYSVVAANSAVRMTVINRIFIGFIAFVQQ